jgi:hypothetical protein
MMMATREILSFLSRNGVPHKEVTVVFRCNDDLIKSRIERALLRELDDYSVGPIKDVSKVQINGISIVLTTLDASAST